MKYRVRHRTVYRYLQEVSFSCHLSHLVPRPTPTQSVEDVDLQLTPQPSRRMRRPDYFGNIAEWFYIEQPHEVLDVLAESHVTVNASPERNTKASPSWEAVRALLDAPRDAATRDAVQYIFNSPLTAFTNDVAAYARLSFPPGRSLFAGSVELMSRIHKDFRYNSSVTSVTTTVTPVFEMRAGVCQDFAHVGIACMRALGLPARYVSGYLLTHPPEGQPRLVGADASHAWFSVWTPDFGWVDLDPTNDVLPGDSHVTVAWGRDYGDVAPIGGIVTGGRDHIVEVGVDVVPIPATETMKSAP